MRKHLIAFSLALAFSQVAFAASFIEKQAILLLSENVTMRENLSMADIEFRWDEDVPLKLDIWSRMGRLKTFGEVAVFDEAGREVPIFYPISMPLIPDGQKEVKKGELVRIGLYIMGSVQFPRPGRYYAVVKCSDAWSDGKNVRFTTKKRWFTIVGTDSPKA